VGAFLSVVLELALLAESAGSLLRMVVVTTIGADELRGRAADILTIARRLDRLTQSVVDGRVSLSASGAEAEATTARRLQDDLPF